MSPVAAATRYLFSASDGDDNDLRELLVMIFLNCRSGSGRSVKTCCPPRGPTRQGGRLERALVAALAPAGIGKLDYGNFRVEGLVGWGGLAARARLGYGAPWGGGLWRNLEA